jgi:starch-binding outer membrane protein, SusD/RagB family
MKSLKNIVLLSLLLIGVSSCQDFVQNVGDPISSVDDALLNNESQADFLITGVQGKFAKTFGQASLFAGGLSDEMIFDRNVPGATYPQYEEMELGTLRINNNSVKDLELDLGQLRLYADTLAGRASLIAWTDTAKMNLTYYTGYLYGGIARFMYAAYFGLEEENGGGVINSSPFIPSATMYNLALERFDQALSYADPTSSDARLVHSLKARIYLITGQYALAAAEAAQGYTEADGTFESLHSTEVVANNFWWTDAGNGRSQWAVDPRFNAYVLADAKEASRIPLQEIKGNDDSTIYFLQNKYPEDKTPTAVLSWQEMQLIQAEVLARNSQNTEALTFVNAVRASHGLDARTETNLDSIMIERDKELFCFGLRLTDQRRNNTWHLPAGTWKFLPITEDEREANPNLK